MSIDIFSALKNPVDFYIMRHGQSEGNAAKILQGRSEYPLSEQGRLQSMVRGRALAQIFKGRKKPLLFSSPQGRARETALIIAEEACLDEPVFIDTLMEMHLGIWTDKTWDQVQNEDPSLWADFMSRSWDAIPEAESSMDLYERAKRFWVQICEAANDKAADEILIITHGGLIQWLLKYTFECSNWFPMFPISNCGQSRLCVKPHPASKNPYLAWEEIDAPIPDLLAEPSGFPA